MLGELLKAVPTGTEGVYCMFDLDGEPAYAGQTSDLRSRLRQHFVRQDSSVVSYGRLDIWDIAYVDWWKTSQRDSAEASLLTNYEPYLNFDGEATTPVTKESVDLENPAGTLQLLTEDELQFRSQCYNRAKQKLEHLLRMIDKIHLAGHSNDTKNTLYEHNRILQQNIAEFLGIDHLNERSTISDWVSEAEE